jgi:hypothetical protein
MTGAVFRFTNCKESSAVGCDESSAKGVNTLNFKGRSKQIPDPLLVETVGQTTVEISPTERTGFANDLGACCRPNVHVSENQRTAACRARD